VRSFKLAHGHITWYDYCNSLERSNEQVHKQNDSTEKEQCLTNGNNPATRHTLELVGRISVIQITTVSCITHTRQPTEQV